MLRNNLTTPDHPLGIYHPHEEFIHIKKDNIGLIEVMGLAILPGRLKKELEAVEEKLLSGEDMTEDPLTKSHAKWAADIAANYEITAENVKAGSYALSRPFLAVTNEQYITEDSQKLIDYITSEEGQQIVEDNKLITID